VKRVAVGLAAAAVVAGCGVSGASSHVSFGPGPAVPGCGPSGAKTLAHSADAVVYSLGGRAYGCASATGKSYKLGSTRFCIGTALAGPFALVGTVVAYGLELCGVDTSSAQVLVERLTTGHLVHKDPMTSTGLVEQHGSPTALAVRSDGSDAWIGVERSINGQKLIEVYRHDRRRPALLDSGAAIHPTSLALHGTRLSWRHGSRTRHATLR